MTGRSRTDTGAVDDAEVAGLVSKLSVADEQVQADINCAAPLQGPAAVVMKIRAGTTYLAHLPVSACGFYDYTIFEKAWAAGAPG